VNANIAKALLRDALYQVLDNKVFRILVVLVLVLVAATFAIGARPEELVILFGWRRIAYEDVFLSFGLAMPDVGEQHAVLIQTVQGLMVDKLAGTFGITLAVAATAFFMPRMVEKGAADIVFSKPVSRLTLMLSRYVSGLVFVSILAVLLVGGMHAGFLLNSGYSDPGFLWSTVTLIYLFGLLHAFSVAIGVLTRSTVAAILLTLLFLAFNGCVHVGWKGKESYLEFRDRSSQSTESARAPDPGSDSEIDPAREDENPPAETSPEELNTLLRALFVVVDGLHYTLPKTSDATLIAKRLRRTVEDYRKALVDTESGLEILVAPAGFGRERGAAAIGGEGALWTREVEGGQARIRLQRLKARGWRRDHVAELRKRIDERPGAIEVSQLRQDFGNVRGELFDWREGEPPRVHRLFTFDGGGFRFEVEAEGPADWMRSDEALKAEQAFLRSFSVRHDDDNPFSFYEERFGWTAPLKYNAFFSIGSSLAFAAVMLALGWWRLSRIDF
jgi:ABC-type transport system involved in multi-copper enzyme maturation permease subunit